MEEMNYLISLSDFSNIHTSIYCEDPEVMKFNAPHHFQVRDTNTNKIIGEVHFQEGPIKEYGINGISNEDALFMVLTRLESFQTSKYVCEENEQAIACIKNALNALKARTERRTNQNIEGTSITEEEL